MMDEKKNLSADVIHNIIMENRERMSISGVEDVETFNEEKIVMITQLGALIVEGRNLHINKLSVDTGEMLVEGELDSLVYHDKDASVSKSGFFARLFQ